MKTRWHFIIFHHISNSYRHQGDFFLDAPWASCRSRWFFGIIFSVEIIIRMVGWGPRPLVLGSHGENPMIKWYKMDENWGTCSNPPHFRTLPLVELVYRVCISQLESKPSLNPNDQRNCPSLRRVLWRLAGHFPWECRIHQNSIAFGWYLKKLPHLKLVWFSAGLSQLSAPECWSTWIMCSGDSRLISGTGSMPLWWHCGSSARPGFKLLGRNDGYPGVHSGETSMGMGPIRWVHRPGLLKPILMRWVKASPTCFRLYFFYLANVSVHIILHGIFYVNVFLCIFRSFQPNLTSDGLNLVGSGWIWLDHTQHGPLRPPAPSPWTSASSVWRGPLVSSVTWPWDVEEPATSYLGMVCNGTSRETGWFRGIPVSGNLHTYIHTYTHTYVQIDR